MNSHGQNRLVKPLYSVVTARNLILLLLPGIAGVLFALPVEATDYTLTTGGLTWNNNAAWTPNTAFPISGDSVQIGNGFSVTVSAPQAFGTNAMASNLTGPGNTTIILNLGQTLTHVTGSTFNKATAGDLRFTGFGMFVNQANANVNIANNRLLFWSGNSIFENYGTVTLTETGSALGIGYNAGDAVQFRNFGDIVVNAAGVAVIQNDGTNVSGQFIQSGNPITFTNGGLQFSMRTMGTLNDTNFAQLFDAASLNAGVNKELRIGGEWDSISLSGSTNLNRVRLEALVAKSTGTTINVTNPSGITLGNIIGGLGNPTLNVPSTRTMTNAAGSLIVKASGADARITGDGTFVNNGTVDVRSNRLLLWSGDVQFQNNGLMTLSENGSSLQLAYNGTDDVVFNNNANGVIRTNLTNSAHVATIQRGNLGTDVFNNLGTVEVLGGQLTIANTVTSLPQITGGGTELDGGTWRVVSSGTVNSTLNILAGGTGVGGAPAFDGTIDTINAGAKLVLASSGSSTVAFPQLGALQTVDGELYVHGTMNLPVASTMNVTGTVGGDGQLTTSGSVAFSGGELDPSSLAGGPGTLTINGDLALSTSTQLAFALGTPGVVGSGTNDLVQVNGDLTLAGVLDIDPQGGFGVGSYRLFNYTGTLTDLGVTTNSSEYVIFLGIDNQVNLLVLPVPEPGTGLLILAGLIGLRRGIRRRTAKA